MANEETLPQMRDRIDAQNKELAELRADNRRLTARETFREAGLNPAHGDLFAANTPKGDITVETVQAFATQFNLVTETGDVAAEEKTEEPAAETSAPSDAALSDMSGGGSGPGEGGAATAQQRLTRQEWNELQKTDPVAARQALLEGRVELRKDNFYVQNRLVKG